jgi:hypothetical protein
MRTVRCQVKGFEIELEAHRNGRRIRKCARGDSSSKNVKPNKTVGDCKKIVRNCNFFAGNSNVFAGNCNLLLATAIFLQATAKKLQPKFQK